MDESIIGCMVFVFVFVYILVIVSFASRSVNYDEIRQKALDTLQRAFDTDCYDECFMLEDKELLRRVHDESMEKYGRWIPGEYGPIEVRKGVFLIGKSSYRKGNDGKVELVYTSGFGYD